jgi:hypothetical protein
LCDGAQHLHRRRSGERAAAGEHFVQHGAKAEDVRAGVEGLPLSLFRRHVCCRPDDGAVHGLRNVSVGTQHLGQAEVQEFHCWRIRRFAAAAHHQHVCRFQVAVQDPAPVCGLERAGHLNRQAHGFVWLQRSLQRHALDILEDQVIGPDVVDLTDVRMIQCGDGAGFVLESIAVRSESLDGDAASEARVSRLPDFAHPTRAERCQDLVRSDPRAGGQGNRVVHEPAFYRSTQCRRCSGVRL